MKNKKILILHSSNDLYGASKIFLQIIQILKNSEYEIHIVLPSKGPLDNLISQNAHVSYYSLGVLRKKYLNPFGLINRLVANIKAIKFLSNYINTRSIDLIYTNTSTILCGGIAAKKNGVPSIFHIHEIPSRKKLFLLVPNCIETFELEKLPTIVAKTSFIAGFKLYTIVFVNTPLLFRLLKKSDIALA